MKSGHYISELVSKIPSDRPILIAGPTASGKSDLALQLAAQLDGIIINGDALQVYQNWHVLTARPSTEDTLTAPHALYGHVAANQKYSVGHWLREVKLLLNNSGSQIPIIVGGTGLYFSSLTNGLAEIPDVPIPIRQQMTNQLADQGLAGFAAELARHDPQTHARIDIQNPMRVQRAWEVLTATGRGLADWQDATPPAALPLDQCTALVVEVPKSWLDLRISRRFEHMIAAGAVDECRKNRQDWQMSRPSSRAIGAPELMRHLAGELTLEAAKELATIATRQYAKRQRSWFRAKMKNWTRVDLSTGICG